ncbi:hypothetical protein QT381_14485, partial [Galbitalea sp. SE-J8]|nr:hypothetical protein [Galbitalea sp. SE-J8]
MLADVATELYGLTPDRFTAERNRRAGELRGSDRALADAVRALPKPSTSAWLVDMLVRHRPPLVAELLALGAAMREAQADLDEVTLRRLGHDRRPLVGAIAREGLAVAEQLGHPVGAGAAAEVEATLQAALADADAASAVASGLLVRALAPGGFDRVDLDGAVAVPGVVGPGAAGAGADADAGAGGASAASAREAAARAARAARDAQRAADRAERA